MSCNQTGRPLADPCDDCMLVPCSEHCSESNGELHGPPLKETAELKDKESEKMS